MADTAAAMPGRDVRVVGLISAGHFCSHFFQLVLPPLFPTLKSALGVSYTELGLLTMLFYTTSGLAQTPSGFLVDRFGARNVLIAGLALLSGAVVLFGLAPGYWAFLPLVVLAGLGNSVFHPADYAILTSRVGRARLARAYSVHTLGGNLGWAAAPAAVLALSSLCGSWRLALIILGTIGLGVALLLLAQSALVADETVPRPVRRREAAGGHFLLLLSRPILLCFLYFALLSVALIGLQTFMPPALHQLHGTPLAAATTALTAYLLGGAVGILLGGIIADRSRRHEFIVMTGLLVAGALVLLVGTADLGVLGITAAITVAGFASGSTTPSRDMLVRAATPAGATGKVFGFVYSGLDLGSAVTPPILGFFLDNGLPRGVFILVAAALVAAIASALALPHSAPGAQRVMKPAE